MKQEKHTQLPVNSDWTWLNPQLLKVRRLLRPVGTKPGETRRIRAH